MWENKLFEAGGFVGFAFRIEFDATTGDNPTITKETFDE